MKKIPVLFLINLLLLSIFGTNLVIARSNIFSLTSSSSDTAWIFPIIIIAIIAMAIVGILVLIWIYKDAEKRGQSGILWLLIVLVGGIVGLIVWLVIRPPIGGHPNQQNQGLGIFEQQTYQNRMCTNCGRHIPFDAQVCKKSFNCSGVTFKVSSCEMSTTDPKVLTSIVKT